MKKNGKTKIKTPLSIINSKVKTESGVLYTRTCAYCGTTIEFLHTKKLTHCPNCGKEGYIKPYTETQLFLLQKLYIENRDQQYLGDMYLIMYDYSKSILKKLLPASFTYNYSDLETKAHDAVIIIIQLYLEKKEFKIENSFAGYIEFKVKEVLWNKKTQREDDHSSLDALIASSDNSNTSTLGETFPIDKSSPMFNDLELSKQQSIEKVNLVESILKVITNIMQIVKKEYGYKDALLLIIGLWIEINNSSSLLDRSNFYEVYKSNTKQFVDKSLLFIYEYLQDNGEY